MTRIKVWKDGNARQKAFQLQKKGYTPDQLKTDYPELFNNETDTSNEQKSPKAHPLLEPVTPPLNLSHESEETKIKLIKAWINRRCAEKRTKGNGYKENLQELLSYIESIDN